MSFIIIEGQIVNLMAVSCMRLCEGTPDLVEISLVGRPGVLFFKNDDGLWDKLCKMASTLRNL